MTIIVFSERIYRALLTLYPADYRLEYGALMAQVFRDVSRDAYHSRGAIGLLFWWCETLLDLTRTVIEQRRKAGIQMSVLTRFLRRSSGILLIAGGALMCFGILSELQPGWNYPLWGIYQLFGFALPPAIVLMSLGTIGLLLKYQHRAGSIGKLALFGAAGGGLVNLVALIPFAGWNAFIIGFLLQAVSMIVFGLTALGVHPLPRWNWLPIIIGTMPLLLFLVNPTANGFDTEWENIFCFLVMGASYVALGYVIQKGHKKETIPAAA